MRVFHSKRNMEKNPNAILHKCCAQSLDAYLQNHVEEKESTVDSINRALIAFAGEENLSFRSLASQSLLDVCKLFFQLGQCHPHTDFTDIFKPLTVEKARELFVSITNNYFQRLFKRYSKLPCCALAIDAGKLKSKSYLEIMLISAIDDVPPLSVFSVQNFNGTTKVYREIIIERF